ncbi:hypothetical protein CKA32_004608 [Geitlerinema sp. FC II]|nr:hypothetical protein CKA32_004608 [Geitlerinema sp. FC II]
MTHNSVALSRLEFKVIIPSTSNLCGRGRHAGGAFSATIAEKYSISIAGVLRSHEGSKGFFPRWDEFFLSLDRY